MSFLAPLLAGIGPVDPQDSVVADAATRPYLEPLTNSIGSTYEQALAARSSVALS